jgi:hypothetical protein
MSQDFTYTIDRYLKGQLSEEERRVLEEKMQQDPLLAQEVIWQKDIYHALGDVRRAALKSRLDNIVIHPTPHFFGQRWLTAAAVGTLLLAGSAYYYLTSKESIRAVIPQKVEAPLTYPEAYTLQRVPQRSAPKRVALPTTPSQTSSSPSKVSNALSAENQRLQPTVIPPQVVSRFDEDPPAVDHNDFRAPEKSSLQANTYQEENVAVEALSNTQYVFHYQFFDNKLYLHGDFDQTPYKIIALNTENSKKLFLEFDGAYYRISEHRAVVPLTKIEDPTLVKSLKSMSVIN